MRMTFRIIGIGDRFMLNGNEYVKQSTRTAKMLSTNRVFYIGQMDVCEEK